MVAVVQSFWAAGALSPFEQLCIRSFLDHGHRYRLYSYENGLIVPAGTELLDAAMILPRERMYVLRSGVGAGSVSSFSNHFRYELLFRMGGWWVDTDVVCLAPDLPGTAVFYALQGVDEVNGAVLRFPPEHPVMRQCRDAAERIGSAVVWGQTGPTLLTAVLRERDLLARAAPQLVCYPLDWTQTSMLFDSDEAERVCELCRGAAVLHLWNEMLRRAGVNKFVGVPEGSFLDTLFGRHEVVFPQHPRYTADDIRRLESNRLNVEYVQYLLAENESLRRQLEDPIG